MKILVIHGSARQGNTYALTHEITNRLKAKPDVDLTEFSAADLELPFCRSCHVCFARGEEFCPHCGALRGVRAALLDCDGVILSGATYMWALNGAMKNLLDHFAYLFHRPALFGKRGMAIATSKGAGEKSVAKYLKTVLGQWGVNGALAVTDNEKAKKLQPAAKRAARLDRAAERFYSLLKSEKQLPPSLRAITVHNSFRAMSLSEFAESERDKAFWSRNGFADRAYPAKAGPVKYAVGALLHGAAKNAAKLLGRGYKKP